MRYSKAYPATDKAAGAALFQDGWTKLREPSNFATAFLVSLPFLLLNIVLTGLLMFFLYPPLGKFFNTGFDTEFSLTLNLVSLAYVAGIAVFFALHELLHAVFIPNAFKSNKTVWGINGLGVFVYSSEIIGKRRHLLISLMPFVVLSLVLPALCRVFGLLNTYIVFLCLLNAAASCVDCLGAFLIALRVPSGSVIAANGRETYYRTKP